MAWAPDYCTVAELGAFLRIADTVDDAELAFAITAASRAVDLYTHRQFGKVPAGEGRNYKAWWDVRRERWIVEMDDLMDLTGLTVTILDVGVVVAYTLEPRNVQFKARPFTQLVMLAGLSSAPTAANEYEVTITALWGWTAVPTPVKEATLLQASRFHARRFSPYGVAGSPELGSELRLLSRVDADVAVSLGPFVRWWGAI